MFLYRTNLLIFVNVEMSITIHFIIIILLTGITLPNKQIMKLGTFLQDQLNSIYVEKTWWVGFKIALVRWKFLKMLLIVISEVTLENFEDIGIVWFL